MSNFDDYFSAQQASIANWRIETAKELSAQADELVRGFEHHTFDSALDLLLRLRSEEPRNNSAPQRVSDALRRKLAAP